MAEDKEKKRRRRAAPSFNTSEERPTLRVKGREPGADTIALIDTVSNGGSITLSLNQINQAQWRSSRAFILKRYGYRLRAVAKGDHLYAWAERTDQLPLTPEAFEGGDLIQIIRWLLPLAEEYLREAPSHPDHAKLETARAVVRAARDSPPKGGETNP